MNLTKKLLYLILLLFSTVAYAMEPQQGQTSCDAASSEECRISWNLIDAGRSEYKLERYDPKTEKWVVEQADITPYGVAKKPATQGSLYRVVGCSYDPGKECVSSTVYWAPVIPESVDQIPTTVQRKNGDLMEVTKKGGLRTQILQYNVYLLIREFEEVDLGELPKMSEPPEFPESLVDLIHVNVYPNYMGNRDHALGIPDAYDPVRPDAQIIHKEGHPEHTHD